THDLQRRANDGVVAGGPSALLAGLDCVGGGVRRGKESWRPRGGGYFWLPLFISRWWGGPGRGGRVWLVLGFTLGFFLFIMPNPSVPPDLAMQFHFGNHVLDVDRRELRRGSDPVAVEPQVFDLLIYLVQNRDRVVSKDDLIASVWGGRIVSDSTLT